MAIPKQLLEAKICNKNNCKEIERLNNIIKETTRILNSARNHYSYPKTNWAIERALKVLKRA